MSATIIALLLAGLPMAGPTHLSPSKISLHLIGHYTPGARKVVAAGPRVLKVLDLGPDMLAALRAYKGRWPQGKTVLRIYTTRHYERGADPAAAARDFWQTVLKPALDRLSPADRKLLDYLEGPNEGEAYPVWESPETAAWFARFWQTLAPLIAAAGPRPCAGSIPVGN
ncbi:MAG: hypothetical protein J7M26_00880, partial [Armatimonadetes bacterium]|nr:hypothetical protein [Armatimonadota bacterium]